MVIYNLYDLECPFTFVLHLVDHLIKSYNMEWKGVFPALTTMFTANDELDFEAFNKNVDFQISSGVDGLILGGSLGEASTLTKSEKNDLTRYTVEEFGQKVPVVMNIAEQSTSQAVEAANMAQDNGAVGLMLLPPMRYNADGPETVEFFTTVARNTDLPIMIYNNPVDYKIMVTLEMFDELAKYDNINAVKESTRDTTNITRMINRFGDRIKILCGVDTLALESLLLGANGWVAGLVDAFPQETVAIYRLAKAGRIEDALKIYRWFMPLLELDIHPKLVQNIKLAEVATGIGTENVRAPRLKLAGSERERVLGIINKALAVRATLPDYLNL